MTKEEMIKYKKIRFLQIVKEEYERPKKNFIKKIPLMSDEELEDEADNIIVGKEVREEIEKRQIKMVKYFEKSMFDIDDKTGEKVLKKKI